MQAADTDTIIDQWSPLSHKTPMQGRGTVGPPSWVPADDQRRLRAYLTLDGYLHNVARRFLATAPAEQREHREYGDAALLVDRIVAGVLGDTVTVTIPGDEPAAEPDLPEHPGAIPPDADPLTARVHAARLARWEQQSAAAVDAWLTAWDAWDATTPFRQQVAATLTSWFTDEQVAAKLDEQEHDTVGLGDGVLTVAWSAAKQRPVLTVHDCAAYFPVITDYDDGYPTKVHVAWEHGDNGTRRLRRLTWELVPCEARTVPYQTAPVTRTCLFSDGEWDLGRTGRNGLADLSDQAATWATTDDGHEAHLLDLGIDFIPVVHVPNTTASKLHYGVSALTLVAQLLDDIAGADSDNAAGARFAAGPAVALASDSHLADGLDVRPGTVYTIGAGGRMDVLDLAASLEPLQARLDALLDRLSVNARVPAEILGRVNSSAAVSGVHLALSFGPFAQLVETLRLSRAPKHRLLLKIVTRLYQVHGTLPAGDMPEAVLSLGAYLPSDRAATVDQVTSLLAAKAISPRSAVRILAAAGWAIGDADAEVARIVAADTKAALEAADATGSAQVAADRLGVDLPVPAAPPTITLPEPGA